MNNILGKYERLVDQRKNRTAADPFVIALAQINNCKVVTAEHPRNNLLKPNIPDVCDALNIQWMNPVQLMREEGWTF